MTNLEHLIHRIRTELPPRPHIWQPDMGEVKYVPESDDEKPKRCARENKDASMNETTTTERNKKTGQYAHAMDKVCVCGATKGEHMAEPQYDLDENDCPKFRATRKK